MAHTVICSICGEKFDRDKIEAVPTSVRRYAHATCVMRQGSLEQQALAEKILAEQAQSEKDLTALEDYVKQLFNVDVIDTRLRKQINNYHDNDKYSYSGILKSLIYFYEVKGNSIEKANGGIGIVPYIYNEAKAYYTRLWQAQQINQAKPIEQYIEPPGWTIKTTPPKSHKRLKKMLFSFLDKENGTDAIKVQ